MSLHLIPGGSTVVNSVTKAVVADNLANERQGEARAREESIRNPGVRFAYYRQTGKPANAKGAMEYVGAYENGEHVTPFEIV